VEVEGVLADVYRFGNRQAFNVAFQSLGLDCANWTEPIYADLVRKAHGDEKRMLVLFFDGVWPISSPSTLFGQVGVSKSGYSTSQVSHLLIDIEVENRTSSEFFQFL
jgi:hypothetical protein